MRILVTFPGTHLTGAARVAALTSAALHARGHHVVAAVPGQGEAFKEFFARLPTGNVTSLGLTNLRRGIREGASYAVALPQGVYRIATLIRQMRPNVVIGHCVFNAWTALAARMVGVPFVSVVHELPSAYPWPVYRAWSGLLAATSQTTVAVSPEIQTALMQGFPLPRRCVVVRPGIDTNVFHEKVDGSDTRKAWLLGASGPLFVCVSHLMPGKGQQDVVEALPRVLKTLPHARVVFVGGTNEVASNKAFAQRLENRIAALGLQQHVQFAGSLNNTEVAMAAADVVLYPSHGESFGLVPLEATALGRSVVACRVGFAPQLAALGAPVYLAEPSAPTAFADAMIVAAGQGPAKPFVVPALTVAAAAQELEALLNQL